MMKLLEWKRERAWQIFCAGLIRIAFFLHLTLFCSSCPAEKANLMYGTGMSMTE